MDSLRFISAQPIPRARFLFPRALYTQGMLSALVTSFVPPGGPRWADWISRSCVPELARLANLWPLGVPASMCMSGGVRELVNHVICKARLRTRGDLTAIAHFERMFARFVSGLKLPPHEGLLGYSYSSLEALQRAAHQGKKCVVVQIDAGALHQQIVEQEEERWPNYALPTAQFPAWYFERVRQEWKLADLVLANSSWTKDMLLKEGVPAAKIEVIPLAYNASMLHLLPSPTEERLRVLWLGNVTLGRGIQYLIEAAKLLKAAPVDFLIAGQVFISREAINSAPSNVTFMGSVPRAQVKALFARSHVLAFPTLSDGFGMVQLEALANGVPIVTTPNCGDVVEHGLTGLIVPARRADCLGEALLTLARDPSLLSSMRERCFDRVRQFSVAHFAERLARTLNSHFRPSKPSLQA